MQFTRPLVIGAALAVLTLAQAPVVISPTPKLYFTDANGKPLAGGCVRTYQAGTTTPMATYTDASGATANPNPVTLDSSGRAAIWIAMPAIKYVVVAKSSGGCSMILGNVLYTIDNVQDQGMRLRSDLAAAGGGALVGYAPPGGTVPATIADALNAQVLDIAYSTLASGCSAANGAKKTLVITKAWTGLATQTLSCSIDFLTGGTIQPASTQTVTFAGAVDGDLSQHFDMSASGHVVLGPNTKVLYPQWFGAKMDGAADDSAAWNYAVGACTKCTIQMSQNATSRVGATINLSGAAQAIRGQGQNSVISGSGITILQMSGPATGGQVLENLTISDPAGNAATIGLLIDNGSGNANNVLVRNVAVTGAAANKQGIGIQVNGSVGVHLDQSGASLFGTGLLFLASASGNTNVRIDRGNFSANAARGIDVESTNGDFSLYGTVLENNGTQGLYTKAATTSIYTCHFESNGSPTFEAAGSGSQVLSVGTAWQSGRIQIDSGAQFSSFSELMSGVTITNNSPVGNQQAAAVLYYPTLSPTIAGTGWTDIVDGAGTATRGNNGIFSLSGRGTYNIGAALAGNPLAHVNISNATDNAPADFLGTGTVTFHGLSSMPFNLLPVNQAVECTAAGTGCSGPSATGALTAKLVNPDGTLFSFSQPGIEFLLFTTSTGHTLGAGANTININNLGNLPIEAEKTGAPLAAAWTSGAYKFRVGSGVIYLTGAQ